jgi:hypothetical protein
MASSPGHLTALDILRLQALEDPPRGLVLVVGTVAVLLGLADRVHDWAGCRSVLNGQVLFSSKRSLGGRRPNSLLTTVKNDAVRQKAGFFLSLQRFDLHAVTAAQRETVLGTVHSDTGGLMQPHHLEQVGRAAVALGRWLQAVYAQIKAESQPLPRPAALAAEEPPPPSSSTSPPLSLSLFDAPEALRCSICDARVERGALAEHERMCAARKAEKHARMAAEAQRLQDEQLKRQQLPPPFTSAHQLPSSSSESSGGGANRAILDDREGLDDKRTAELAAERVQSLRPTAPPPELPPPRPRIRVPSSPSPPAPPSPPPRSLPPSPRSPPVATTAAPVSPSSDEMTWEQIQGGFDYLKARTGHSARAGYPSAAVSKAAAAMRAAKGWTRHPADRSSGGRGSRLVMDSDPLPHDEEVVEVISREVHVAAIRAELDKKGMLPKGSNSSSSKATGHGFAFGKAVIRDP